MILINLLPPELRRARRSGVNPLMVAAAGGATIVLLLGSFWGWVKFSRLKQAEIKLSETQAELVTATEAANKVRTIDAQITDYIQLHATITQLITRKVLWARTLDDFANLLSAHNGNHWNLDGYEVRCAGLTVAPATASVAPRRGGGAVGETVSFSFRTSFKILGDNRDRAGEYPIDFFQTVEASKFWRENGFTGRAEDQFKTVSPTWKQEIKKVTTDLPIEWTRVKVIPAGPGAK